MKLILQPSVRNSGYSTFFLLWYEIWKMGFLNSRFCFYSNWPNRPNRHYDDNVKSTIRIESKIANPYWHLTEDRIFPIFWFLASYRKKSGGHIAWNSPPNCVMTLGTALCKLESALIFLFKQVDKNIFGNFKMGNFLCGGYTSWKCFNHHSTLDKIIKLTAEMNFTKISRNLCRSNHLWCLYFHFDFFFHFSFYCTHDEKMVN